MSAETTQSVPGPTLAGAAGSAVRVGDTLRCPPLRLIWRVDQVMERGVVVEVIGHGHKDILEWYELEFGSWEIVSPNSGLSDGRHPSATQ